MAVIADCKVISTVIYNVSFCICAIICTKSFLRNINAYSLAFTRCKLSCFLKSAKLNC